MSFRGVSEANDVGIPTDKHGLRNYFVPPYGGAVLPRLRQRNDSSGDGLEMSRDKREQGRELAFLLRKGESTPARGDRGYALK